MPKPYREVFTILRGADIDKKDRWVRSGVSFTNKDGSESVILQAALLLTIREAQQRGLSLNQHRLADFLHSHPGTISEMMTKFIDQGLCDTKSIPKQENCPSLTGSGEEKLLQYAEWKYGNLKRLFNFFSRLPGHQMIMSIMYPEN